MKFEGVRHSVTLQSMNEHMESVYCVHTYSQTYSHTIRIHNRWRCCRMSISYDFLVYSSNCVWLNSTHTHKHTHAFVCSARIERKSEKQRELSTHPLHSHMQRSSNNTFESYGIQYYFPHPMVSAWAVVCENMRICVWYKQLRYYKRIQSSQVSVSVLRFCG